jgi:hypothetical protein
MHSLMIAGCIVLVSVSGCISMKGASTNPGPTGTPAAAPSVSGAQPIQASPPASSASPPVSSVDESSRSSAPSVEPVAPAATSQSPSPATSSSPAQSKSSTANQPTKQTATAASQAPVAAVLPSNKPVAQPTLNLADLEQRLRDTHAIGVFTKLSLKNQVDDLLNELRTLYKSPDRRPSPELRQRYDLLLLKVLSLLQDSDPSLAAAISSSREAIWGILSDPEKFSKI